MQIPEGSTWTDLLMQAIQSYHAKTGVRYTVIGRRAIGDSRLWDRLCNGGDITLAKAEQAMRWLDAQENPQPEGDENGKDKTNGG